MLLQVSPPEHLASIAAQLCIGIVLGLLIGRAIFNCFAQVLIIPIAIIVSLIITLALIFCWFTSLFEAILTNLTGFIMTYPWCWIGCIAGIAAIITWSTRQFHICKCWVRLGDQRHIDHHHHNHHHGQHHNHGRRYPRRYS